MKILDCTFRDGGYYNDWNFSNNLVNEYFRLISSLSISLIEPGYITNTKNNYGIFYNLNNKILYDFKKKLRTNQKLFVMVNAKEVETYSDFSKLLVNNLNYVDGVRVAVPSSEVKNFVQIISKLKEKFYKTIFHCNIMYLSLWFQNKYFISNLSKLLKNSYIDCLSIVDSYGAMAPHQVSIISKLLKQQLGGKIELGCHFHNNSGLALANTLAARNEGFDIGDSTIKGMGRGAGNAETEILLTLLSKKNNVSGFDLNNLIEKFDIIKTKLKWGSSFAYSYAAQNGFSQSEMMDLIQKKRLEPGLAVNLISLYQKKKKEPISFGNLSLIKRRIADKKIAPLVIGGADSFLDLGESLFYKINPKQILILTGKNALLNLIELKKRRKIDNQIILILTGNELNKINIDLRKIFKQINFLSIVIEKNFCSKKLLSNKKLILSNSIAANPLMISGLLAKKIGFNEINIAFFDGDMTSDRSNIVMNETSECVKLLSSKLKINSYTKTYLKVNYHNIWNAY